MSGGDHGAVPVEKGIRRRKGGTYAVQVCIDYEQRRRSFKTLREARAWRDAMFATRRGSRKGRVVSGVSPDATRYGEQDRQLIKSSPRTKEVIDGREWTVVHLPPTAGGI